MRLRSWPLVLVPWLAGCALPDGPLGSAEEPIKVCAGKTTLKGIDVSHYDGAIDWAQVKTSGRDFAFVKATEGLTYTDAKFAANWAAMKQNGVVRGAYHFFHANLDPIAEADHFLQVMGPLEVGDLPPTLDLEVTDGQTGAVITAHTLQWLDHVAAATGLTPILYTSPSFVTATLGSPAGLDAKAQLWIANWQVACPDVPAPFTAWPFWQSDDMGTVPGIAGSANVDLDIFNGGAAELQALTLQGASTSASSGSSGSSSSAGAGGAGGAGGGSASGAGAGGASSGSGRLTSGSGTGGAAGSPGEKSGCATAPGEARGREGAAGWLSARALLYHAGRRRRPAARTGSAG